MHDPTAPFKRLLMSLMAAGAAASAEYNKRQDALPLAHLLDLDRVLTDEGALASLAVLDELTALTALHKKMFATFCLHASQQLTAAMAELPAGMADTEIAGIRRAFENNLREQDHFYRRRETWIDANRRVCQLFQAHRDGIKYQQGRLIFDDPTVASEVDALLDDIEAVHQEEVARQHRLKAKISLNLPIFYATIWNPRP